MSPAHEGIEVATPTAADCYRSDVTGIQEPAIKLKTMTSQSYLYLGTTVVSSHYPTGDV